MRREKREEGRERENNNVSMSISRDEGYFTCLRTASTRIDSSSIIGLEIEICTEGTH